MTDKMKNKHKTWNLLIHALIIGNSLCVHDHVCVPSYIIGVPVISKYWFELWVNL